jgi:hypothetical protein
MRTYFVELLDRRIFSILAGINMLPAMLKKHSQPVHNLKNTK